MEFKFYGGASEVGRSAILLKGQKNIMLDFGVKIDHKAEYPVSVPHVDAVVLSHAHLDHSGDVPAIYNSMLVPTFGTEPTLALSNLLLKDSMKLARMQHLKQTFHKQQLHTFQNHYVGMDYNKSAEFGGMSIEMHDAGHISGSAITLIEAGNMRVVYTGDFKLSGQYLHKGADVVKSDVLITESTYATREHPDRRELINRFIENVKTVIDNNGIALVPVFAVGRSQEILTILYEHNLSSFVYLDGMAREATSIVLRYPSFISNSDKLKKAVQASSTISEHKDRMEALEGPSIILTTAGMLNGGPVLTYITELGKSSAIMLTGYQVDGTNGRMLLDKHEVAIGGNVAKILNEVQYYDFSAHAGRSDLYKYVKESSPQTVICVHGDKENSSDFAESLKLEGFDAYAPKIGDTIKLDK
ncbi:MAG: MBL fold metallo-hydrolase [Candidatus Marsarchaeota archaeon]|jgi:putative mRNA 3-end processing factor|nr:MBL fold metallo-hydrolase [Candidatus Marsarchaeota archaeon]MCL5418899.1 MBL fold metallo-hydrolase [Candidatus Marsarchaeota archaeon]